MFHPNGQFRDAPGSEGAPYQEGMVRMNEKFPPDAQETRSIAYTSEAELRAATVGELKPLTGLIEVVTYDPGWPGLYEDLAARVRAALGERVLQLEHVGSTSVPGLAAKPRIDMLLVVADSSEEDSYVPALEDAGFALRIREPDWYEHRLLNARDIDSNVHVFTENCPEIERMLMFRDWLIADRTDRDLYERTKRELASRSWKYTQNYADAKTTVVEEILARAMKASVQPDRSQ